MSDLSLLCFQLCTIFISNTRIKLLFFLWDFRVFPHEPNNCFANMLSLELGPIQSVEWWLSFGTWEDYAKSVATRTHPLVWLNLNTDILQYKYGSILKGLESDVMITLLSI